MRKILLLMMLTLSLIPFSVTSASSATYQTISSSGTISYLSSWILTDPFSIAKTDFKDITLSNVYRHGVLEWYPEIQTWAGWANEGDLIISQHPTDPSKKAMNITFGGMRKDQKPIRPNFSIFLDEANTITAGVQEIWVEAKYYFPEDFSLTTPWNPPSSLPWMIWCEPFVEYEESPYLSYPSHNFDANFFAIKHPTEDFYYLQLSIVRRGMNSDGTVWSETVFADRWNQQKPLPLDEEFTVRWHVTRHRTNGIFELWLNDEKIVDYVGQTTEKGEVDRVDLGWTTIPLDHYSNPGNPVTSNYLTYLEVWGR